jgi:hypothetical protein
MSGRKPGYKFYRNNLIKLALLSVPICWYLWDKIHGRGNKNDDPSALIIIAVIMVFGNIGLFIAMRKAKRREDSKKGWFQIALLPPS